MFNKANKTKLRFLFVCLVVVAGALLFTFNRELFTSVLKGDIETLRPLLEGNLVYAYMIMLIVMVVQSAFSIIPLLVVITINITLFGFVNGFIWSWLTSIVSSIVVFFGVRYVFQEWLIKKIKPSLIEKVEEQGFAYVFQARILPFLPTSIINILAGLSTVRFNQFLFGTIVGNFFYFFVLALIPAGLFSAKINEFVMGVIVVLSLVLYYGIKKMYKRKRKLVIQRDNNTKHL
jgi:uncharacterized membrane protein YdjX (TVP38/TMEM64 family)